MGIKPLLAISLLLVCLAFASAHEAESETSHHQSKHAHYDSSSTSTLDELINSSLVVPAGNEVQVILFAVGFQIYVYDGKVWTLNNVSADLYDFKGIKVAHHFFLGEKDIAGGQASWETFHPYSLVTAKAQASVPQNNTIPWLLLEATNTSGSSDGFGTTTFVQRLYTHNGVQPAADYPAEKGDVFKSKYTALYTFSTNIHGDGHFFTDTGSFKTIPPVKNSKRSLSEIPCM